MRPFQMPDDASGTEHDAASTRQEHELQSAPNQPMPLFSPNGFVCADAIFVDVDVGDQELMVIECERVTLADSAPGLLLEAGRRHLSEPLTEVLQQVVHQGCHGFLLIDGRLKLLAVFNFLHRQNVAHFAYPSELHISDWLIHQDGLRRQVQYPELELMCIEP